MKSSLRAFALLATTAAVVQANPAATGFYVALQAGANANSVDYTQDASTYSEVVNDRAAATMPTAIKITNLIGKSKSSQSLGRGAFQGGLILGYNYGFSSCAVAGIEIFANFDGTNRNFVDYTDAATYYRFNIKRGFNYGANILLGYFVTPNTQLHIKAGIDCGQFKINNTVDAATLAISGSPASTTSGAAATALAEKKSKTINFLVGGGVRTYITKTMFIGLDYAYVFGSNTKLDATGSATPHSAAATNANLNPSASFKVCQHRISASVGYKF